MNQSLSQTIARQNIIAELDLLSADFVGPFDRLTTLIARAMNAQACVFAVPAENGWFIKSGFGCSFRESEKLDEFLNPVLQKDQNFQIHDVAADKRFEHLLTNGALEISGDRYRSLLVEPVHATNQMLVGALCWMSKEPRSLRAPEKQLMADAAAAFEDALVLHGYSVTDTETGLFNRKHFEQTLMREWRRAYRHLLPMSLILIKMHRTASEVHNETSSTALLREEMIEFAEVCAKVVRRGGDLIARFDSHTLVLALPETPKEGAEHLAEELFSSLLDEQRGLSDKGFTLSIGIGVAEEQSDISAGADALLNCARGALDSAVASGEKYATSVL